MEIVSGKIQDIDTKNCEFIIRVPCPNIERAILRKYEVVQVGLPDGRTISPIQREKAHALIGEIAKWAGELPGYVKRLMKMEFMVIRLEALEKELFSLSNCDITTAREFTTYLIDFIIEHDIPTKKPLREECEDIARYVYYCLINKKCAICRKQGQLHHYDAIGMGNDRDVIYQIGMMVISLCGECHSKAHTNGREWLTNTIHLQPIALTAEIGKKYKLTKKNLSNSGNLSF